jgi:hypothetical protein
MEPAMEQQGRGYTVSSVSASIPARSDLTASRCSALSVLANGESTSTGGCLLSGTS